MSSVQLKFTINVDRLDSPEGLPSKAAHTALEYSSLSVLNHSNLNYQDVLWLRCH